MNGINSLNTYFLILVILEKLDNESFLRNFIVSIFVKKSDMLSAESSLLLMAAPPRTWQTI